MAKESRKAKVYLVEDNEMMSRMYTHAFEFEGYVVTAFLDGASTLQALKEKGTRTPDILLLDIVMPKEDGIEVLKKIRQLETCHALPVVVLTNYPSEEKRQHALKLNSVLYLVKSEFTPREIVKKVGDILDN